MAALKRLQGIPAASRHYGAAARMRADIALTHPTVGVGRVAGRFGRPICLYFTVCVRSHMHTVTLPPPPPPPHSDRDSYVACFEELAASSPQRSGAGGTGGGLRERTGVRDAFLQYCSASKGGGGHAAAFFSP